MECYADIQYIIVMTIEHLSQWLKNRSYLNRSCPSCYRDIHISCFLYKHFRLNFASEDMKTYFHVHGLFFINQKTKSSDLEIITTKGKQLLPNNSIINVIIKIAMDFTFIYSEQQRRNFTSQNEYSIAWHRHRISFML